MGVHRPTYCKNDTHTHTQKTDQKNWEKIFAPAEPNPCEGMEAFTL